MAKVDLTRREWIFEAAFEPGEVPDLAKQYTKQVLRPTLVIVKFDASNDERPRFGSANIQGPRVNKDGLGVGIASHIYSKEDLPEWAAGLVDALEGSVLARALFGD